MNNKVILYIIGGVLGLGLIVAIAVSAVSGGGVEESEVYEEVTVEGDVLPVFGGDVASDIAPGMTAPTITGVGFDDGSVTVGPDGRSKVVIFLAHWCPHCQAEVPRVVDWLEAGNKPENVDFYAVSTSVERLQGNYPPEEWLIDDEGWTVPTIQDDDVGTAAASYGMAGTPFWVALDGNNQVIVRVAGELGDEGVEALFGTAAQA